ncbi:hypothetical protein ANCCAN_28255 [Ancylostoma caninum]|uniref:Uncharacterized protein n=1 Tax=Ancylostoma caninum TaxID=29170 RepID=A0A368F559_ANCCA|nr:hypothetical protein ANCCAN_28255 [Ancylostoma caninum]
MTPVPVPWGVSHFIPLDKNLSIEPRRPYNGGFPGIGVFPISERYYFLETPLSSLIHRAPLDYNNQHNTTNGEVGE